MKLISLLLLACLAAGDVAAQDRAAFVTRLGQDTLAVERFERTPSGIEATVLLRTPQTTLRHYRLDLDEAGALRRFEAETRAPDAPADAPPTRRAVFTPEGDSLRVEVTEDGGTQSRAVAATAEALPFLDMIHWPFELMLPRAAASGRDSLAQPLFTERGGLAFTVRRTGEGAMTVTHPFRGTMAVEVDPLGRLLRLDAGATTRKLTVERVPEVDLDVLAQRFAALDAAGQGFGPLSGRDGAEAIVHGATIALDYGQPARRGREVFGALVPWGELWRTGANMATHLETDRPLAFGALEVPAGRYTLFSIPEPEGGVLIINRQTGQNGNAYDSAHDLGRVPMTVEALPEPVELFTMRVEETAEGGVLVLEWDRTRFAVPFTVR